MEIMQGSVLITAVLGVATIILALLAQLVPLLSALSVTVVVTVLLIAAGIVQTIFVFRAKKFYKGLLMFLYAGLSIAVGGTMLIRLVLGLDAVAILLLAYFVLGGIFEIIIAFRVKLQMGWDWLLASGVPGIVLVGLIGWEWALSGVWAIDASVGIRLWFTGWWMIVIRSYADDSVSALKPSSRQETENRIIPGFEANSPTGACAGQRLTPG